MTRKQNETVAALGRVLSAPTASAAEREVDEILASVHPIATAAPAAEETPVAPDPKPARKPRVRKAKAAEPVAAPEPVAAAPARTTRKATTPIDKLDAFVGKFAAGDLSAPQRSIADTVKNEVEVGQRIAAIGALQHDDPEAFGRALVGLGNFLWSCRS